MSDSESMAEVSLNFPAAPILEQLSLWPHQQYAVTKLRQYLHAAGQNLTNRAALVHMPTGSGKTGVIAALARCVPETMSVLVLSPRIALRQQLARDLQGRFFDHLDSAPPIDEIPKEVVELDGPFRDLSYEQVNHAG